MLLAFNITEVGVRAASSSLMQRFAQKHTSCTMAWTVRNDHAYYSIRTPICRRQDADASRRGDADARLGQPDADAPGRDAAARAGDPQLGPHQVRALAGTTALRMGLRTATPTAVSFLRRYQDSMILNDVTWPVLRSAHP